MGYQFHGGSSASSADTIPVFRAVITPNCSLSDQGLKIVLAAVGAASLAIMSVCWASDLWPASLFTGADAVLLAVALIGHRISLRRAQCVAVWPGLVRIEHMRQGRAISRADVPALALVLEREDDPDHGCLTLALRSQGCRHVLAGDLSPGERAGFADAFRQALDEAGASYRLVARSTPAYGWEVSRTATGLHRVPSGD